ncbi:ThuA domain-containing protein [Streptomyces sp. NPDC088387]|uniref:ThuA domain-containing protein n=1 Tax=Streptomyces sp. NPDC088387 TaxID=3365859 RepID=UPI00382DDA0A
MTHVLILAGTGRYGDQWHDHAATSREIARVLEPLGVAWTVLGTVPAAFERLETTDLLVVNTGRGPDPADAGTTTEPEAEWKQAHAALIRYLRSARPVIGVHSAALSFRDVPEWGERIGTRWITGHSMHPPLDTAHVEVDPAGRHPVTQGLASFDVTDERYTRLKVDETAVRPVHHLHQDRRHPLVVLTEHHGRRTVYDALGHDTRSYRSPERCRLLLREAAWALGHDDEAVREL